MESRPGIGLEPGRLCGGGACGARAAAQPCIGRMTACHPRPGAAAHIHRWLAVATEHGTLAL